MLELDEILKKGNDLKKIIVKCEKIIESTVNPVNWEFPDIIFLKDHARCELDLGYTLGARVGKDVFKCIHDEAVKLRAESMKGLSDLLLKK